MTNLPNPLELFLQRVGIFHVIGEQLGAKTEL